MKTLKEIKEEIKRRNDSDEYFFGFGQALLVTYLPFDEAEEFLVPEAKKEEWNPKPLTKDSVEKEIKEYLPFAWEKCKDQRGLSAERSVEKLGVWAWLLERNDLVEFAEDEENYSMYGEPILRKFFAEFNVNENDD